jgi:hypothetical protein
MAFIIDPEEGETILLLEELRGAHGAVFAFGITNQAIYLPAKKTFARSDPYYFRRIPLAQIQNVALVRIRPWFLYIVASLMIIVGAMTTYWMMSPVLSGKDGDIKGYPIAVLVVGFVLPFVARGRKALVVNMTDERYRWKPQIVIDKVSRLRIANLLNAILQTARKVGVVVNEL